ncbi:sugar transferase [Aeromicrobium sp. Leaf350]|uniref:sugar transferase n=1 Tax=Aeromicrobium sp. Leaf350 TaxID=2876565 RepID=UPI001E3B5078|nr:sugar transferase [Aeromicrobium sp. Leaf350]
MTEVYADRRFAREGPVARPASAKRAVDVTLALLLLVVLSPVMLLIAVLVKAGDGGPVLFHQIRVGRHGAAITVLKFRTMRVGAENALGAVRHLDETGDGPLFKVRDDPRVTRVGRLLRRTSLDELPQLFNVVAGSMSLVGPRPALVHEVASYSEQERRRLLVRPGITGLWQVNGRSTLAWDDGVELDLHYVEHRSMRLDLWILLRTIPAVLLARGAY